MSSTVGKEGYNLPIFHVNQAPEVAVAFVACCLGDLILEKGRMKIQALPLTSRPPSPNLKTHSHSSLGPLQGAWTQQRCRSEHLDPAIPEGVPYLGAPQLQCEYGFCVTSTQQEYTQTIEYSGTDSCNSTHTQDDLRA